MRRLQHRLAIRTCLTSSCNPEHAPSSCGTGFSFWMHTTGSEFVLPSTHDCIPSMPSSCCPRQPGRDCEQQGRETHDLQWQSYPASTMASRSSSEGVSISTSSQESWITSCATVVRPTHPNAFTYAILHERRLPAALSSRLHSSLLQVPGPYKTFRFRAPDSDFLIQVLKKVGYFRSR